MNISADSEILKTIRLILLITAISTMIGLEAELFLLGHLKALLQLVPVIVIAVGLGSIAWYGLTRTGTSIRVFQVTMSLCIAAGVLGMVFHLAFSATEARKKQNSLYGMRLIGEALTGVAPPLAPAALIQVGVIGLAYTLRHPALEEVDGKTNQPQP